MSNDLKVKYQLFDSLLSCMLSEVKLQVKPNQIEAFTHQDMASGANTWYQRVRLSGNAENGNYKFNLMYLSHFQDSMMLDSILGKGDMKNITLPQTATALAKVKDAFQYDLHTHLLANLAMEHGVLTMLLKHCPTFTMIVRRGKKIQNVIDFNFRDKQDHVHHLVVQKTKAGFLLRGVHEGRNTNAVPLSDVSVLAHTIELLVQGNSTVLQLFKGYDDAPTPKKRFGLLGRR